MPNIIMVSYISLLISFAQVVLASPTGAVKNPDLLVDVDGRVCFVDIDDDPDHNYSTDRRNEYRKLSPNGNIDAKVIVLYIEKNSTHLSRIGTELIDKCIRFLSEMGEYDDAFFLTQVARMSINCHSFRNTSIRDISSGESTTNDRLGSLDSPMYSAGDPRTTGTEVAFADLKASLSATDLVKPMLFHAGGCFYSVYSDCRVSVHFISDLWPGQMIATMVPGNLLFVAGERTAAFLPAQATHSPESGGGSTLSDLEISRLSVLSDTKDRTGRNIVHPPTLRSCGTDAKGTIWIADKEGHLVAFDTSSNAYRPYLVRCPGARQVLVPRSNLSGSAFAYDEERKILVEHALPLVRFSGDAGTGVEGKSTLIYARMPRVGIVPTVSAEVLSRPWVAPGNAVHILHSDADALVYVTPKSVCLQGRNGGGPLVRPTGAGEQEVVEEGIYDAARKTVWLLLRKRTKDEANPYIRRESWWTMRLAKVVLSRE